MKPDATRSAASTPVEYAIPSRGRADVLVRKTLPLLRRLGVEPAQISIFVAEEERAEYADALRAFGRPTPWLRSGGLGMAAQRAAIVDHYMDGQRVVSVDDDLRDLIVRRSDKVAEPIEADEWAEVVEIGWRSCASTGARLWGLYPVPNPYFMRARVRTDLTYIGGGLFGAINDRAPDSPLRVTLEDKEDYERSIRCYLADGAVARIEWVAWRTEGYAGAGGMQEDGLRTAERIRESAETLARRYPDLATLNLSKKSGKAEVRLRDRREVAA